MNLEYSSTIKVKYKIDSRTRSGRSPEDHKRQKEERQAIHVSMKRWRAHNKYGRSIGRGLSESELIDKVAGEIGATKTHIRSELKQKN